MLRTLIDLFGTVSRDRRGVTAAEYAILAVGIVIVVGSAVFAFQAPLQNAFSAIGSQITTTQSSITSR